MIGALKGIIETIDDDSAIIDVAGVGYHVFASHRTLSAYSPGEAIKLIIETHVREDHIHLYAFPNTTEREWFRLLTSVQRVGSKMALSILSALAPAQLLQAIMAKDTTAFSRISGVGAKLAERIVTELKDKALKLPVEGSIGLPPTSQPAKRSTAQKAPSNAGNIQEEAISALANLGFSRTDAYAAIQKANTADQPTTLDQLIRLSLKELART